MYMEYKDNKGYDLQQNQYSLDHWFFVVKGWYSERTPYVGSPDNTTDLRQLTYGLTPNTF